jgi:hypothetical protein
MKFDLPVSKATSTFIIAPSIMRVSFCREAPSFVARSSSSVLAYSQSLLLRGGDDLVAVDLGRVGMRLGGMSSYALVSSLLLGAAISLFSMTPIKIEKHHTKLEAFAMWAFTVLVALSIVTSLHTAITMNMLNLYANTALGKGLDARFLEFWNHQSTSALRESAFQSFMVAIQTFKGCFALTVFLKSGPDAFHIEGQNYNISKRWVATIAAVTIMAWSSLQHRVMLKLAGQTIFRVVTTTSTGI